MRDIKPPWAHQAAETARLVRDPARAVFFRPRLGKTRTVVDAAAQLFMAGTINTLVVSVPPEARSVWADPDPMLGELSRWWPLDTLPELVEFRAKTNLKTLGRDPSRLTVLVTNPEFVRRVDHLADLRTWLTTRKTMLVADESWAYQSAGAKQTKALWALGLDCVRKVILNGTPGTMEDAYGQYRILGRYLFPVQNWTAYRARYLVMGGYMNKKVVGFAHEDEFQRITAPITTYLRREDVFEDLPPARIQIEVPLTAPTWKLYTEMRRELIAWLSSTEASVAAHAGAKVMRLAQITSGILGGLEVTAQGDVLEVPVLSAPEKIIGSEKVDAVLSWLAREGVPDKVVIAARFKPDVRRLAVTLAEAFPAHKVRRMFSEAPREEKDELKRLFTAGGEPDKAIAIVNAQSGGAGLSLAQSNLMIVVGHEFSYRLRDQLEERIADHQRVTYLDVIATGPKGEPTVDRTILAAQRGQQETFAWTAQMWRDALSQELTSTLDVD